ncbi:hypothetical protein [Chitinivibrio alkaliphilus]|uniref:Polyhydroxyalkanoate synthesis regulator phasin n=1 Tax=Chitinivibrio alkaliphilus ACht1 TaxID=1313304 RepID=U7D3V2_9BACT|nr:hypothetical protein [Chitinivibrio alkaliphilus]ERP31184.1 hypothetical protein CALK_1896 [Chitinivibrio alkaliphilus ACht1]
MKNFIKGTLFGGIGLGLLTSERIERLLKDMIQKSEMSKSEGEQFMAEVKKKSEKTQKEIEKRISEEIQKALSKLNLSQEEQVAKQAKKITALEKRIRELESSQNDTSK